MNIRAAPVNSFCSSASRISEPHFHMFAMKRLKLILQSDHCFTKPPQQQIIKIYQNNNKLHLKKQKDKLNYNYNINHGRL